MPDAPYPFTAASLSDLLKTKVIKSGKMPISGDPSILELAECLNLQHAAVEATRSPRPSGVGTALLVLDQQMPLISMSLGNAAEVFERHNIPGGVRGRRELNDDILATEGLIAAIANFRKRNLVPPPYPDLRRDEWKDCCDILVMLFKQALPTAAVEASYRFISAVTPYVTGEAEPSIPSVKTHLTKRRG